MQLKKEIRKLFCFMEYYGFYETDSSKYYLREWKNSKLIVFTNKKKVLIILDDKMESELSTIIYNYVEGDVFVNLNPPDYIVLDFFLMKMKEKGNLEAYKDYKQFSKKEILSNISIKVQEYANMLLNES
jgi:hypothetical protein